MIYPQVTAEKWCETYGLTPETRPCKKCGKMITTLVPVAFGTWRGLQAPDHGCGARYLMTVAIDIEEDERSDWARLAGKTKD